MKINKSLILAIFSVILFKFSSAMEGNSNEENEKKHSIVKIENAEKYHSEEATFKNASLSDGILFGKLICLEFKLIRFIIPTDLNQIGQEIENQLNELLKKLDIRFDEISSVSELFSFFIKNPSFSEKIKNFIIKDFLNQTLLKVISKILEAQVDVKNLTPIESLLSKGADVNTKTPLGDTLLHMAADCGCLEVASFLLAHNANTDEKDNDGNTALDIAIAQGRQEIVKIILAKNAN